jgi:hypothetical protein
LEIFAESVFAKKLINVPEARCKLCFEVKDLRDSHFMPRGLYDYFRAPGMDPIIITSELVMATSRQTTDYLLCQQCEEVLNNRGENWLLPKLARLDGPFPLYEILKKRSPDIEVPGIGVGYAASSNPEINTNSILHFAAGIFWKASVHPWKKGGIEPRIDLGPYAERLRQFVLGRSEFPNGFALLVGVTPPDKAMQSLIEPFEGDRSEARKFLFDVPGMHFALEVGKTIPTSSRQMCFATNVLHPILVRDFATLRKKAYLQRSKNAHRSERVRKFLSSKSPR